MPLRIRVALAMPMLHSTQEALDQQKLGVSFKHTFAGGGELRARNYYLKRDFQGRLPFTSGGIVEFDRFFAGGGISYTQRFVLGNIQHRWLRASTLTGSAMTDNDSTTITASRVFSHSTNSNASRAPGSLCRTS